MAIIRRRSDPAPRQPDLAYCTKRYEAVLQRIGYFKECYSRVANHYDFSKHPDEPNAISVTFVHKETFNQADQTAGGYVLRTSPTNWSLERIVRTYLQLTDIEATFRTIKSDLGLLPIITVMTNGPKPICSSPCWPIMATS